jgi:N-acetylneuraminate synthase
LAHPVDKENLAEEALPLRKLFTKSVVAGADLPSGTVLQEQHLRLKKPGTGIPASRISQLIGSRLLRQVRADELILEKDLEGFN